MVKCRQKLELFPNGYPRRIQKLSRMKSGKIKVVNMKPFYGAKKDKGI
jgi:hypothetical protein